LQQLVVGAIPDKIPNINVLRHRKQTSPCGPSARLSAHQTETKDLRLREAKPQVTTGPRSRNPDNAILPSITSQRPQCTLNASSIAAHSICLLPDRRNGAQAVLLNPARADVGFPSLDRAGID